MVMSLNEDLPCGFWAADDFQSWKTKPAELPDAESVVLCTCRKRFLMKLRSTPELHMQFLTSLLLRCDHMWPWPTTMFNRGILTGLYSNGSECRIQLNCRSVQRMRSRDSVISCQKWCAIKRFKRMRVRGRLPPKLASYTYTKLPLKCTTKTYPKTVSTFSTSSCPSMLPKNSLAPVSARALPCGVTWFPKLGGKQQRHCTHTHIKEIWYFHVAGGIPKVLYVCITLLDAHACWKSEVFFGGCWWGPQWNWLWIPRFCTESRGEESNPTPAGPRISVEALQNYDKKWKTVK